MTECLVFPSVSEEGYTSWSIMINHDRVYLVFANYPDAKAYIATLKSGENTREIHETEDFHNILRIARKHHCMTVRGGGYLGRWAPLAIKLNGVLVAVYLYRHRPGDNSLKYTFSAWWY